MSKKDYVMIANVFHAECASQNFASGPCASAKRLAEMLAMKFQSSNPRFDRDKFLRACGF
jgi:hypothetical protein